MTQNHLLNTIQSAGIAPRHRFTFDEFWQLPDAMRVGKEIAADCLVRFQMDHTLTVDGITKRGVVLWGKFGTCKTTLASSALIAEAQAGGVVLSVNFAALLDDVQDAYSREDVKSEDIIRAAQRAPFALLDDLGDPRSSAELSADKIRITHKVLDYRNDYMLPTIITTNCSQDQLKRQITPRTFERLRELCHWIEVHGENLRQ